jgi:hypothetical protein
LVEKLQNVLIDQNALASARNKRKAESDGFVSNAQGGSPEKEPPTRRQRSLHNEYLVRMGHEAYLDRMRPWTGSPGSVGTMSTDYPAFRALREMAEAIEGGPEVWEKWRANVETRDTNEMNVNGLSRDMKPVELLQQIHPDLSPYEPLPGGDHKDWAERLRRRLRDDERSVWNKERIKAEAKMLGAVANRQET